MDFLKQKIEIEIGDLLYFGGKIQSSDCLIIDDKGHGGTTPLKNFSAVVLVREGTETAEKLKRVIEDGNNYPITGPGKGLSSS